MLKVILQYTDCLQDGKKVFAYLASKSVAIVKTTNVLCGFKPKIHVLVSDIAELNNIVHDLNTTCSYEVRVVKVLKMKRGNN